MKSDLTTKSSLDENSVSSVSNGSALTGEDLSGGSGHHNSNNIVSNSSTSSNTNQQLSSLIIAAAAASSLSSLGVPQPAHQASSIILTRPFASFDGIHSGVPTKTTPTLTPTTLKNIEQTFIELTNDTSLNIPCQAGFVPPPFQFEDHSQDRENSRESMSSGGSSSSWQVTPPPIISEDLDSKSSSTSFETAPHQQRPRSAAAVVLPGGVATTLTNLNPVNMVQQQQPQLQSGNRKTTSSGGTRRNMGGRRPTKASNLSPEEEEKRRVRRERNKQAAARCRRRREDHTNELVDETDQLERKKQALQDEIKQLQDEKRDLEFLLENHREHCRLQGRSRSPLERKPMELLQIQQPHQQQHQQQQQQQQHQQLHQQQQRIVRDHKIIPSLKIKAEPDEMSEPPEKKAHLYSDSLETPTPTSIVAPVLTSANLPRLMLPNMAAAVSTIAAATTTNGRPARPTNLDVKATTAFPLRNISMDAAGVGISTPSNGLFNFDSLMDGGTGLTPVAAPISLQSNRGPLDLITPTTSEPSKLCSL